MEYWGPLESLTRFIHSPPAAFFHPQTGIASRLDLDNAIDFHLLVLLTANSDGITKNFYLARPRPETAKPTRFFFVPWDYDGTFGRNWDASRYPANVWLSNHLMNRLLQDAAYRRRFAARWRELRKKEFATETIQRMIDDNAGRLGAAAARNFARWPTTGFPDRITFEQDLAQMKQWIAERGRWLDETIARRER